MRLAITLMLTMLVAPTAADDQLEQVVSRALEATRAAREAIPRAKGAGTYEMKGSQLVDGELRERVIERGTLSVAYSGDKDFIMFQVASGDPEPEYDAQVFINNGRAILGSHFSPKMHPHGADGRIIPLHQRELIYEPGLFGIAPHCLAIAFADIDRALEKLNGSGATLEMEDGQYIIQLDGRSIGKGYLQRYQIDPAKGYYVSRSEVIVFPENRVVSRVEKDWAQTESGLWYVRRIVEGSLPRKEGGYGNSRRFEFTSFDANVDIPEELFTIDASGLPPGARILDMRVNPYRKITVIPPETDLKLLERVVGKLPTVIAPPPPEPAN